MASGSDVSNRDLLNHILRLENDIALLKSSLSGQTFDDAADSQSHRSLDVYIDLRTDSERKPYIVTVDGLFRARVSMSAVRVMVLLVLLLDFKDRCDGGRGILDRRNSIKRAYDVIVGGEVTDLDNTLRSALYRFEVFLQDQKLFRNDKLALRFDFEECRLRVENLKPEMVPNISVSVSSPLPVINEVIHELLSVSPLTRLRREKALYAPAGPQGIDLMLAEIFDHRHPVTMTALFSRPSIQNFPVSILQKMQVSDQRIRRAKVVQEGYQSGRCRCLEILPRESIKNLIRVNSDGKFLWCPEGITSDDVVFHLNHWAELVEGDNSYSLAITDAATPFHLATFELHATSMPEFYTMFMQRMGFEFRNEEGCFIVGERSAFSAISQHVVHRMLNHPTTTRESIVLAQELRSLSTQLQTQGPITVSG